MTFHSATSSIIDLSMPSSFLVTFCRLIFCVHENIDRRPACQARRCPRPFERTVAADALVLDVVLHTSPVGVLINTSRRTLSIARHSLGRLRAAKAC